MLQLNYWLLILINTLDGEIDATLPYITKLLDDEDVLYDIYVAAIKFYVAYSYTVHGGCW